MGKKDSSSKKKSSKRKTPKIISQTKKKKSRRNRSKKSRRDEHSVSSYSDDESKSLLAGSESNYSSGSEDDRKNRKGRSQARGETKSRKKRTRRRSSSPDITPKKRKRSKKDVKLRSRKKRKRDLSLSSVSESQSCSSCQGLSSNSGEEREPRRKRGRSRESKKHKHGRSKVKIKSQISRSKSPSSYSRDSHHVHNVSHGEEGIATEYVSRRLRSVITVVKRQEEEEISAKDSYKEEVLDDRYDYPSSRSNDSYDEVNKNESDIALDKTETEGNEKIKKEGFAEYDVTDGATHAGDPGPFHTSQEAEVKHGGISSQVYEQTEDLELLLRQKALENLRKFLVEKQRNLTTKIGLEGQSETTVIQSSAKTSNFHEEPMKLDRSIEQDPATYLKTKNSRCTLSETNANHSVSVECERSHGENTREDPVMNILNGNNQTSKISEKDIVALDVNVKLGSSTPAPKQKTVLSEPVMKLRTSSQHPVGNSGTLPAKSPPLTPSFKNNQATGVVLGVSSSTDNELKVSESTSGEKIVTEQQDQSKDGSQYEKKTMSVMRGGEMVQVSYKVYIPKKTPALHRRQLKR